MYNNIFCVILVLLCLMFKFLFIKAGREHGFQGTKIEHRASYKKTGMISF